MKTPAKKCKECGKKINPLKGRADRQYCNELCKNRYHNKRLNEDSVELKRIERILRKNHGILKRLFLRKDNDSIERERMLKDGFDFSYHTHRIITKIKKNEFIFCYGYGYRPVNENKYKIIKAFEYREY